MDKQAVAIVVVMCVLCVLVGVLMDSTAIANALEPAGRMVGVVVHHLGKLP